MKLIIRDYLATLNETPQLSSLLSDLLPCMRYRIERLDFRGVVQHGVDIAASIVGKNKKRTLCLFVLKRGNIDSRNWDKGTANVRETLNNIIDVPFKDLTKPELKKMKRRVILVHNGDVNTYTLPRLEGMFKQLNEKKFSCERWDLGKLVDLVADYLLTERLFKSDFQSNLRQTLAFLEIDDYDLKHYKEIISKLVSQTSVNYAKYRRLVCQIRLLILMVYSHAVRNNNSLNHVLDACEFSILKIYAWLRRHKKHMDKKWMRELTIVWNLQSIISLEILEKIKPLLTIEDGIALGGMQEIVEYPLRTFRLIGMISYQLIFLKAFGTKIKVLNKFVSDIYPSLRDIIINMSASKRPLLDNHSIDIVLGVLALCIMNDYKTGQEWIKGILGWLSFRKRTLKTLPEGRNNINLVIEAESTGKKPQYYVDSASTLITVLFELCILFGLNKTYSQYRNFFSKTKIDLQTLYPSQTFWEWLFEGKPSSHYEEGNIELSIKLPKTIKEFSEEVKERFIKFDLSYEQNLNDSGTLFTTLLACKYYRIRIPPYFWRKLFINVTK